MKCIIVVLLILLGIIGILATILFPTTIWLGGAIASAVALVSGIGFWVLTRNFC